MVTYLLDTRAIIDALDLKRGRYDLLESLLVSGDLLACCPISITEVYSGVRPKEKDRTERFLNKLDYCEVTREVAAYAGALKRDRAQAGVTLSVSDVTMAAVAIHYGLVPMTDNVQHYPMPDIVLYSPPTR